jgi:hypothetical protein
MRNVHADADTDIGRPAASGFLETVDRVGSQQIEAVGEFEMRPAGGAERLIVCIDLGMRIVDRETEIRIVEIFQPLGYAAAVIGRRSEGFALPSRGKMRAVGHIDAAMGRSLVSAVDGKLQILGGAAFKKLRTENTARLAVVGLNMRCMKCPRLPAASSIPLSVTGSLQD